MLLVKYNQKNYVCSTFWEQQQKKSHLDSQLIIINILISLTKTKNGVLILDFLAQYTNIPTLDKSATVAKFCMLMIALAVEKMVQSYFIFTASFHST